MNNYCMNNFQNVENIYKQTLVFTASPSKLIFLLYNKAITELKVARQSCKRSKTKALEHINHTYKILNELLASFISTEDELYQNLYYIHQPLVTTLSSLFLDEKIDLIKINKVLKELTEHRDTWRKVLKIKTKKTSNQLNVKQLKQPIHL